MQMRKEKPYLEWTPIVEPEAVYADLLGLGEVSASRGLVYWLEGRPAEGGRVVLKRLEADGSEMEITPPSYYIRTRVHEYGGRAYALGEKYVYFVNFADQRIYEQDLLHLDRIRPITPEAVERDELRKYAALSLSPDAKLLLLVGETEHADSENENWLGLINLGTEEPVEPIVLERKHDFYGEPCFSEDGRKIAWLAWDHPNMPWDLTELYTADLRGGKLFHVERVPSLPGGSICQPRFGPKGELYFVQDAPDKEVDDPENWWNLYRYDGRQARPVTRELFELGVPMWTLGSRRSVLLGDGAKMVAAYEHQGATHLGEINLNKGAVSRYDLPFSSFGSIAKLDESRIAFTASGPTVPTAVFTYDTDSAELVRIKTCKEMSLDEKSISVPRRISFDTSDGECAFGQLYLPQNELYKPPAGDKPPLIVMVHGGPTAATSTAFSLGKQFWASSGYAILDVDYRGSTGSGRAYRDALKGKWGVADAEDIRHGVEFLIREGLVAPGQCAITGGSAGGYAVQRVLTLFADLFQAGASYYGIGNLVTLAELTHKFESRYLGTLLGASLEDGRSIYEERSPIHHLAALRAPMVIFQGAEDKIVPPEVSREMARVLDAAGIRNEYVEYPGEAHGFRKKENLIDALSREAAFYRSVFFGTL